MAFLLWEHEEDGDGFNDENGVGKVNFFLFSLFFGAGAS
jgi:hypothetical protein